MIQTATENPTSPEAAPDDLSAHAVETCLWALSALLKNPPAVWVSVEAVARMIGKSAAHVRDREMPEYRATGRPWRGTNTGRRYYLPAVLDWMKETAAADMAAAGYDRPQWPTGHRPAPAGR